MYQQLKLRDMVENERERCFRKLSQLEYSIKKLPEGHLALHSNSIFYVVSNGDTRQQKCVSKGTGENLKS